MNDPDIAALFERFFAAPNLARRDSQSCVTAYARRALEAVQASIDAARAGDKALPLILPFVTATEVTWFAIASDAGRARELQELMLAWVGPSWSTFTGGQFRLEDGEWVGWAIGPSLSPFVFRVSIPDLADVPTVCDRLAAMLRELQRRPSSAGRILRTTFQVRTAFDRALVVGDVAAAEAAFDALRRSGSLTAENVRFVEIRLLAGLRRWDRLFELPSFRSVCDLRLPRETFADVLEAVYEHYLSEHERAADAVSAIAVVRPPAFRTFAGLFRTRRDVQRPAVLKAFLLWELAGEAPNDAICSDLLRELRPPAIGVRFRAALEGRIPLIIGGRLLEAAEAAFDEDRIDDAFEAFLGLEPTSRIAGLVLRCAREIDTKNASQRAISYLEHCSQELRDSVVAKHSGLIGKVADRASRADVREVASWQGWLRAASAGVERQQAVEAVREGCRSWDLEELVRTRDAARELADAVTNWSISETAFIEEIFAPMYEAFVTREPIERAAFLDIYIALLTAVSAGRATTKTELALAKDVAAMCLACNPERARYATVIGELKALLLGSRSYNALDWAIDICDELSASTCPDRGIRHQFVSIVFETAESFRQRLTGVQIQTLQFLGSELGITLSENLEAVVVETTTTKPAAIASSAKIAIYSLQPGASARARGLLQLLLPNAAIEMNEDTVCTERLKNLARTSDVVGFSWKTSTHQAFYCVKDHLGPQTKLCMPAGAGSSSLVRAIFEQVG